MDWALFLYSFFYSSALKSIIRVNPKYKLFLPQIQRLDEIFEQSGKTIYKGRNEIKVMTWGDPLVNVKRYCVPNILNRVVYTFLRKPKAVRAYLYAQILREKGINTPEPIAYKLNQGFMNLGISYLVTKQIPNQRMMYEFGDGGITGREHIIIALGKFAAKMHEAECLHLDFSPGNILFEELEGGEVRFTLVDVNRMRFGPVSVRQGCASFARLWGEEDFRGLLAESYASARGIRDVSQVMRWIDKYHHKFWSRRPHWSESKTHVVE